jgi:hypothetical protein
MLLRLQTVGSLIPMKSRFTVSRTVQTGVVWCRFEVKKEILANAAYRRRDSADDG